MSTDDPSVWHGGMGHELIGADGGDQCYRCLAFFDDMPTDLERLIPDCAGPDARQEHHWTPDPRGGIECAYGCAWTHRDMLTIADPPRHYAP